MASVYDSFLNLYYHKPKSVHENKLAASLKKADPNGSAVFLDF